MQNVVGKLVPEPFIKIKIMHISGSTVLKLYSLFLLYDQVKVNQYVNTKVQKQPPEVFYKRRCS